MISGQASKSTTPLRQLRARYDGASLVVYQAFGDEIADRALSVGRFVPPFSLERMSWIKPSFCWMMHRSGWATKAGQNRVLEIEMTRQGFETALSQAALSSFDPAVHGDRDQWRESLASHPVRVQWDPERSPTLAALPWRTIQVGLSGAPLQEYAHHWITAIRDITGKVTQLRDDPEATGRIVDLERPYPLPESLAVAIGASPTSRPTCRSV